MLSPLRLKETFGATGRLSHELARLESATKVTSFKTKLVPAVAAGLLGTLIVVNRKRAVTPETKKRSLVRDICVSAGILAGLMGGLAFYKTPFASKIVRGLSRMLGREIPTEHQIISQSLAGESSLSKRIGELFKVTIRDKGVSSFVKLESLALGGILGGIGGGVVADFFNGENLRETVPKKINEGIFQFLGNITFLTVSMLALATGGKVVGKQLVKNGAALIKAEESVFKSVKALAQKEGDSLALVPKGITRRVSGLLAQHAKQPGQFQTQLTTYLKQELGPASHPQVEGFVQSLGDVLSWGSKKDVLYKVQSFYSRQMKKDITQLAKADTLKDIADPSLRQTIQKLAILKAENRGELFGVIVGLAAGLLGGVWTSNQVNETLSQQKGRSLFVSDIPLGPGMAWYQGKMRNPEGTPWWENVLNIKNWPSLLYLAGVRSLESLVVVMYAISGYFAGTAGTDYSNPDHGKRLALYQQSPPINRNSKVFGQFSRPFRASV